MVSSGQDIKVGWKPMDGELRSETIIRVIGGHEKEGVVVITNTGRLGFNYIEVIPRSRIGKGGVEGLKGKEIRYRVSENPAGIKDYKIVSVRKPRQKSGGIR